MAKYTKLEDIEQVRDTIINAGFVNNGEISCRISRKVIYFMPGRNFLLEDCIIVEKTQGAMVSIDTTGRRGFRSTNKVGCLLDWWQNEQQSQSHHGKWQDLQHL